MWVRRRLLGSRYRDGGVEVKVLEPGERKRADDVVDYEAALPDIETDALRSAGVNVVFKSIFTNEKQWFRNVLTAPGSDGGAGMILGWDWEGEKYGDDRWLVDVLGAWRRWDLAPVDFVVVDGSSQGMQGAAKFLMQLAGLPGAIWCGNFGVTFRSHGIRKAKAAAKAVAEGSARNMFKAIFVAHFLGWPATNTLPQGMVVESKGGLLPSRSLGDLILIKERPDLKIPVSLVSTVSRRSSTFVHVPCSPVAESVLRQIIDRMSLTKKSKLVYIAFGSQGSTALASGDSSYQKIIDQASAVKDAVVFFVLPRNASAEWLSLTGGEQAGSAPPSAPFLGPPRRPTSRTTPRVPDNVILSAWAPQREVLAKTPGLGIRTVFWTHGGVGSLSDAVAHTIPLAFFPLADDQFQNCRDAMNKNLGVDLRPFARDLGVPALYSRSEGGDPNSAKQGATISERLDYLFTHYNFYKDNLRRALVGVEGETLTQDALVDHFKTVVVQTRKKFGPDPEEEPSSPKRRLHGGDGEEEPSSPKRLHGGDGEEEPSSPRRRRRTHLPPG